MTTAPSIRLHQGTTSSASWRVRLALAVKGIAYEPVWLDLRADDHLAAGYKEVAVTSQVPCLEIDGQRLVQSVAIIEYLDETRPTPPLMPKDAVGRARVRSIVEFINSGIQPLHNMAVLRRLASQFGADEAKSTEWVRYWVEHRFRALDALLAQTAGKYSHGDELSLADIFLYPQVLTTQRFSVEASGLPAISRVVANLAQLAAFRHSHPPAA